MEQTNIDLQLIEKEIKDAIVEKDLYRNKMIKIYNKPVPPPSSHPCFFPFPPEIKPPIKIEIKDRIRIKYEIEDSVKEVNRNNRENNKLKMTANIKILTVP